MYQESGSNLIYNAAMAVDVYKLSRETNVHPVGPHKNESRPARNTIIFMQN